MSLILDSSRPATGAVRFPTPPDQYDVKDQREMRRALTAAFSDLANRPDSGRPWIDARVYGVVGDGVTDDTDAMQAALDAGGEQGRVVDGRNLVILISGPLTALGPGLVFDTCSYGNSFDPVGIMVTGSGYTALTWGPCRVTHMILTIWGTGNACNGLHFNNVTDSQTQKIRVNNLNGFGFKKDRWWDSTELHASVELCGNSSVYAYSINNDGDTSNMGHVGRLQVEQANGRAIYIDTGSLCIVIDCIHSERATPIAGLDTWFLGGAGCTYNNARFTANGVSSNATLHLSGEDNFYSAFRVEGGIVTKAEASAGVSITCVDCNFGTFGLVLGQSGLINLYGGIVATFNADPYVHVRDTIIHALNCGITTNPPDPTLEIFDGCTISTLTSTSTLSGATFRQCKILEGGNLLQGHTVLERSTVTCASALGGRGAVTACDTTFECDVLMGAGSTLIGSGITRFHGALGQTTDCSSLLSAGCYATGAVTGLGIPTKQPNANLNVGSVWQVGQRHHNLAAASGGPPGWVCTTAGGNGVFVFKAEANLA